MESHPKKYLGINISSGRIPFTMAVLDNDFHLLAMSQADNVEVLGYCAGLNNGIVTINAPYQPNSGLLNDQDFVRKLDQLPIPGRRSNMRVADFEARLRGISIPRTPGSVDDCPAWMQQGFNLYASLEGFGFKPFATDGSTLQAMESQADIFFYAQLGVVPFESSSLEGRIQRQLILFDLDLPVSNPMNFFEEVTRFRLLHSILPAENILTSSELNAIAMAYMGWLAINEPQRTTHLGVMGEGQITTPELPVFNPLYPRPMDAQSRPLKRQF